MKELGFEKKKGLGCGIRKRGHLKKGNFSQTHLEIRKEEREGRDKEGERGVVEVKLRKIFRNTRDVVKLLNHWGFD